MEIRPFRIAIPEEALADLRERLARTRRPDQIEPGWSDGTDQTWLTELLRSWKDDFDWRARERDLNRLPQFIARVEPPGERSGDELDVHFVHLRNAAPDALPLLLTHGWPGAFFELTRVAVLLSDAFHVVVPSLPGYGFSAKPSKPGTGTKEIAALWAKLMAGLGYQQFGLQGGDLGSHVSLWLARQFPDRVRGLHLNMLPPALQPSKESLRQRPLSESEQKMAAAGLRFRELEGAYSHLHRTKPQTLGHALNDSPAGLAAWIGEKFHAWTQAPVARDELLTNLSIYWFTQTITSSMRLYKESARTPLQFEDGERLGVPLAYADFPGEIVRPPREWLERFADVSRWTEMPRGGHFAALEQPDLLAADVRAFFT